MKSKLLAILVSILFLTVIPSAIGDIVEPDSDVEWIFMRGLLFRCNRFGNLSIPFVIHLVVWYKTSSGFQREVYWFERDVDGFTRTSFRDSLYMGRMYEVGAGLFTYVLGFFAGGLEIVP